MRVAIAYVRVPRPWLPAATIFVRVPADLKRRLDVAARREGKPTNAYALNLFERVLESAEPAVHG